MSSAAKLASLLWAEIAASGHWQVTVAQLAGITPKHLSQMVNGKSVGSLDVVDAILAAVGRELVLSTRVGVVIEHDGGERP